MPGRRCSRRWRPARTSPLFVLLAVLSLCLAAPAAAGAPEDDVLVATLDGPLTASAGEYLIDGLRRAERYGHHAYLVELTTARGLATSMREVARGFLGSGVPVIVHVTPPGGGAFGAGAVLVLAAGIASMAPGTRIGGVAATGDGGSFAARVAARQGRGAGFAESGAVLDARRAEADGVVDLLVPDTAALLDAVDGRTVRLSDDREVTLRTAAASSTDHGMGPWDRFLHTMADPNLPLLFLPIGGFAVIYALASPRSRLAGVFGAVLVALGVVSLTELPVRVPGLLLLMIALGLFAGVLASRAYPMLAVAGSLALVLAAPLLFSEPFAVSNVAVWSVAAAMAVSVSLAGRCAHARRRGGRTSARVS